MFTRQDTKALKGAAILFMLLHHLAYTGDRWPLDFPGFASLIPGFVENGWLGELALNALVCVPLFFFLGGYGLYKRRQEGSFRLLDAIIGLYRKYWKVFVIFVPVGLLFFADGTDVLRSFCVRFQFTSVKQLLIDLAGNFTGYKATFNSEWWFFGAYLCVLPLGCLFCSATEKHGSLLRDIFLVFCVDILSQAVAPGLARVPALSGLGGNLYYYRFCELNKYAPAFFSGIVFAKYDLVAALKDRLCARMPGWLQPLVSFAGAVGVLFCRAYVVTDMANADVVLVPVLAVFLSVFFDSLRGLRLVFAFLGRHSTNIWLIHTFYCYYFLGPAKLVYCTRCVWIDLAVLLALSLGTSVLLELFYKYMGMALRRLSRSRALTAG